MVKVSKSVRLGEAFVIAGDTFVDVAVRLSGLGNTIFTLIRLGKSWILRGILACTL